MSYIVPPGLYALGAPDPASPVVVTANYKMTYDLVRKALAGQNAWLLVLETYGINVWCAAGKGTFGTGELVRRVEAAGLGDIVSHRELILPILGAAGVKGIDVLKRTGFKVRFAAIRIDDLPEFLETGKLSSAARELSFTCAERVILTPVELVAGVRKSLPLLALLFLAGGFLSGTFTLNTALLATSVYAAALLSGSFLSPLFLPVLPTRSFAVKGAFTGLLIGIIFCVVTKIYSVVYSSAAILMIVAVSSFMMLNFTGSTPYTSRSGVKKEMKWALPLQALSLLAGVALFIAGRFA